MHNINNRKSRTMVGTQLLQSCNSLLLIYDDFKLREISGGMVLLC
jgi:hypothetical protein